MTHKGSILVVDDEPEFSRFVADCLSSQGYAVTVAHSGAEALELVGRGFDLALTDYQMAGMDGMRLIGAIHEADPKLPVILITAFGSIDQAVEAMRFGAYDYLTKPVSVADLRLHVARGMETRALRQEVSRLSALAGERLAVEGIVARSPEMRKVVATIRQLERSTSDVLIVGASGTGKELVARALHAHSPVSRGPFVPVNCAAIPEQLLESELFGYTRGAFTDARGEKPGLFQLANHGSIVLDEIAEMPPPLQAKLLRVLEDRRVRRLGATEVEELQVRVISATNRDMHEEVEAGRFREDLYYRLNVVELHIPPLSERPEDVEALIDHFLKRLAGKEVPKRLTRDAQALLLAHPWPGNARQLLHALEHAVALSGGDELDVADFPESLHREPVGGRRAAEAPVAGATNNLTLSELEDRYIAEVLERTGGNRTAAAAILGIDRKTLYARLRRRTPSVAD